jgi:hypothetical protein
MQLGKTQTVASAHRRDSWLPTLPAVASCATQPA